MIRLEELPPDQRAVLSLLLSQRKRYGEVASTLGIAPGAVHDRAHAALAVLAPAQARHLDAPARERIGEYLLGQQSDEQAAATKAGLARSAPQRAWARALAVELVKLTPEPLPEIPESAPAVSRRGGAALLAALGALVAVIVIVVLRSGGSGSGHGAHQSASDGGAPTESTRTSTTESQGGSGSASAAGAGKVKIEKVAVLKPPHGGLAKGGAIIGTENGRPGLELLASGLAPTHGFTYVVWLLGKAHGEAIPLGRIASVKAGGRIDTAELLTTRTSSIAGIEITHETSTRPSHPGIVVLKGSFVSG